MEVEYLLMILGIIGKALWDALAITTVLFILLLLRHRYYIKREAKQAAYGWGRDEDEDEEVIIDEDHPAYSWDDGLGD